MSGNISGTHPKSVVLNDKGIPAADNFQFKKTYTYSHDGMNLMRTESDGFCTNEYRYHNGTDLLAAQYLKTEDKIRKRTFYEYDKSGALRLQIEDDGQEKERTNLQGVTERKITAITNTLTGLPEIIEEKYLDLSTNQKVLLHKTVNKYNQEGKLERQSHYDTNLALLYTLTWKYDSLGNVCKETDALGNETTYIYDFNRNKTYEQGPNKDHHKVFKYDHANRLIREETVCKDRSRFVKCYTYDYLHQLRSSTDIYGNTTGYIYDEFGRQACTVYPFFMDENGKKVTLTVRKKYDLMGNIIEQTDACGATTKTFYTIQGKPYRIEHPDGSVETNEYGIRGNLLKATAKNGAVTKYTYDYQSRPETKAIHDANGKHLYTLNYTYNGLHLLSETDAEGNITYYNYDGAGRVSEVLKADRKTTYEYDHLGRLAKTREHDGGTIITTVKQYDFLNCIVEERVEDQDSQVFNKTQYEYDLDGNKVKTIAETQAGIQITTTRYNALNQPVEMIDAIGQMTVYEYDYDYVNGFGQDVAKCTITDPSGNQTITIKDAMGHIVSVEVKNPYGQTIQAHKNYYNAQGRKARQVETVYTSGGTSRDLITCWKHDTMGHITDIIEAFGTISQKHTRYIYNGYGQLETLVKPDRTTIQHKYDSHDRLIEHFASDRSFHYQIQYTKNGYPHRIKDLVNQTVTHKKHSLFGQVLEETLGNACALRYTYDNLGRISLLTLPDFTQVQYSYNPYRLKKVERLSAKGDPLYAHVYEAYDNIGSLMEATLIGSAGSFKQEKDILNRVVSIQTPHWKETLAAYDTSGNPFEKIVESPLRGIEKNHYSYDELDQLQSEVGHEYRYDSLYNRVSKDGRVHQINDLNQLIDDGDAQYHYDLCGRLKSKTREGVNVEYEYDALDRLIKITEGTLQIQYAYDSDHRRLTKTFTVYDSESLRRGQETFYYLYQGKNEIGSCDPRGGINELRVLGFGHGAEIGAAVAIEIGGRVFAPVHDHNGSVVSLIDAESGRVEEEYKYTAFGEEEIYDETGERKINSVNPWKYASKRMDEETGFVFFGRRYYEPGVGRWITPDPIGLEGGSNVYAYVFNSPLSYFDLYGLIAQSPNGGGANFFSRAIGAVFNFVGTCVRAIGDHILPIPFVGQAVSVLGHTLGGGRPRDYRSPLNRYSYNDSFCVGNGELSPNVRVMYINGIMTNYDERFDGPISVSNNLGGFNVHFTYNSSHGFVLDLVECLAQIMGLPTHSVNMAVKQIREQINAVGGVGSGGRVVLMAHSQGGLITKRAFEQLNSDELGMIDLISFGSPCLIDNPHLNYCKNYVSSRDPVPLADLYGYSKGMFSQKSNVTFIKSKKIFEHSFDCDSYQDAMQEECLRIIKTYGIR